MRFYMCKQKSKIILVESVREPYFAGSIYASNCCKNSIGSTSNWWTLADFTDISENYKQYVSEFEYKM